MLSLSPDQTRHTHSPTSPQNRTQTSLRHSYLPISETNAYWQQSKAFQHQALKRGAILLMTDSITSPASSLSISALTNLCKSASMTYRSFCPRIALASMSS